MNRKDAAQGSTGPSSLAIFEPVVRRPEGPSHFSRGRCPRLKYEGLSGRMVSRHFC